MKNTFIPLGNADLDSFESNLVSKLAIHGPTLGLSPDEVSESTQVINAHRTAFTNMTSKKAESKSATENHRDLRNRSIEEIRRLAKLIKALKTYTFAIGDDLGIIGSDRASKDPVALKPVLKGSINGQEVVIKFRKEGTDGIKIYSKRGSETEFTFLVVDTTSPYNDVRAKLDPSKPEQREYYAYFFEVDSDIGQQSDVLKIVVP